MVFTKWIEKFIAMWSIVMEYDIDEILIDNVQDWFYTNYHRSCYDNDEDYIDDIRTIIAECDKDVLGWCLSDLIDVYFMRPNSIIGKIARVTEIIVKEAKYSLNNFQYSSIKEDN